MFNGGLNGDGFFNEEYDHDLNYGNEIDGGYEAPINFKDYYLKKTGVETEKAMQFEFKDFGFIWLPKAALTVPHYSSINQWAAWMVRKNINNLIRSIQNEYKK